MSAVRRRRSIWLSTFLVALADPRHEEHEEMKEWIGGAFDPTAFDLDDVNECLADIKP